jgi:hypothetical protein
VKFIKSPIRFLIYTNFESKIAANVSNYMFVEEVNSSIVKLPISVRYGFKLINSFDKHSIVAQYGGVQMIDFQRRIGDEKGFNFFDVARSMYDQCITIKCRAVYDISTHHTQ